MISNQKFLKLVYAVLCWSTAQMPYTTAQISDVKSAELVERCVESMGGWNNWQDTRCLKWIFFGRRAWVWDKHSGDVRCESLESDLRIAMNIHDMTGTVYTHGRQQTHPDSLEKYIELGYKLWVNDSYWLVMPFKLKDPGTKLEYVGTLETLDGQDADVVKLTFKDVGVTPDNMYRIYFARESGLIVQWDYYRNYSDADPVFSSPWTGYSRYGNILLAGGRGSSSLEQIEVSEECRSLIYSDEAIYVRPGSIQQH